MGTGVVIIPSIDVMVTLLPVITPDPTVANRWQAILKDENTSTGSRGGRNENHFHFTMCPLNVPLTRDRYTCAALAHIRQPATRSNVMVELHFAVFSEAAFYGPDSCS